MVPTIARIRFFIFNPDLEKWLHILWTLFGVMACLEGSHAIIAFWSVGILGPNYLGTAGEERTYPPLFGSITYLLQADVQGSYVFGTPT